MYIWYLCILVPLLQTSFSLNEEETDLNLLSSNYDAVDTIGENVENIESDESGIVVFDTISASVLEKICKNSNTLVYITQEDITIDCDAFNKGDQPVEQAIDIVKRSADLEEGSGMTAFEEQTTIQPEETTIVPEVETTAVPEEAATVVPEEAATVVPEEAATVVPEEATTVVPEEATTEAPEEATTVVSEEATTEAPEEAKTVVPEEATTLPEEEGKPTTLSEEPTTMPEKKTTIEETTEEPVSPEIPPSRRKFGLVLGEKEAEALNEKETAPLPTPQSEDVVTPKERSEEKPQISLQDVKKEVVVAETPEDKEKHKAVPAVEKTKEVDNHNPDRDAEFLNNKTRTNLQTKEESKQANGDEPDSEDNVRAGSTTNTQKAGSKDTTILIVLFAAVVIVGALAFGYNYVKKRKQQSADLERVERSSVIKRSFQNLSKPEAAEPERKPLIGDVKEVELVDMTTIEPAETSEKPSSEQVVRT